MTTIDLTSVTDTLSQTTAGGHATQSSAFSGNLAVPTADILAVRADLPAFDRNDVDTWLLMCENVLEDAQVIREPTKFRKVLAKLTPEYFRLVKHIAVQSPLRADCFTQLKACLRERLQLTPSTRLRRLETMPPCGEGRPPSAVYYDLEQLYPNDTAHEIIHESFLKRLPVSLQIQCREWLKSDNLGRVALLADNCYQTSLPVPTSVPVMAVDESTNPDEEAVNAVYTRRGPRTAPRGTPHRNSQNNARASTAQNFVDRWCRLHKKYGPEARNCLGSCSYREDTRASGNERSSQQ